MEALNTHQCGEWIYESSQAHTMKYCTLGTVYYIMH